MYLSLCYSFHNRFILFTTMKNAMVTKILDFCYNATLPEGDTEKATLSDGINQTTSIMLRPQASSCAGHQSYKNQTEQAWT